MSEPLYTYEDVARAEREVVEQYEHLLDLLVARDFTTRDQISEVGVTITRRYPDPTPSEEEDSSTGA